MTSKITYVHNLPVARWEEFKNLKIEAITREPNAFTHELSEAIAQPDSDWQGQLEKALIGEKILVFAEEDGKLIGLGGVYLYKKEKFKHNASLDSLYVSPKYRERGIGRALVEKRIELISQRSEILQVITEIFSSQVASIELHKKLGFETVGVLKNFAYFDGGYFDSIHMMKKIR